MSGDRAAAPSAACRQRLRDAQASFNTRRRALIQRFLIDLRDQGLRYSQTTAAASLRRAAAGLFALHEERRHEAENPGAPPLYDPSVPEDFPAQVEAFTKTIHPLGVPGTSAGLGAPEGDYDFVMKELVSLLYVFRQHKSLLTDEAAFNIVSRGLLRDAASAPGEHLTFDIEVPLVSDLLRYPETENHVLMTLSSIYLTRQWIADNPRADERLEAARFRALVDATPFITPLLQAVGRPLHNGFFETNARPYQGMAAHALFNLGAFASDEKLRTGASNAIDYLAARFAFQSLEMKRFGPYRRNAGYADRLNLYENDAVPFMFGAIAGGHAWPNGSLGTGNAAGHALWAALVGHDLPDAIAELMLHKHSGYWARMHSRFSDQHYRAGEPGAYFDKDDRAFGRGVMQALPELYFATSRFMNAAGGRFERSPIRGDVLKTVMGVQDLDFLSRPHALLTRGHFERWGSLDRMAEDVMLMPGNRRFWRSDNSGTYKSFSYGYRQRGGHDIHLDFPMRLPRSFTDRTYRERKQVEFSPGAGSRGAFRFIDLSDVEPYRFYIVLGRVSKSANRPEHREYSRGFWEIVPKERFANVRELKDAVLRENPASFFPDEPREGRRDYRYRMTTGELLELDDEVGLTRTLCENAIRRIWAPGVDPDRQSPLRLSDYAFDRCDAGAIARAPLLDVLEVDDAYRFTGRRLAYAGGDGQLIVDNPHIGATLWLDSSEYARPVRTITNLMAN